MIYILFFFLFVSVDSFSQCSMCRAVVESNSEPSLAQGLNNGILYLMSMPYIFLIISCVLYYMYYKKKTRA